MLAAEVSELSTWAKLLTIHCSPYLPPYSGGDVS